MTKSNPNMENKLAVRWRKNGRALFDYYRMNLTEVAILMGKNPSTVQGNFGGSDNSGKSFPSGRTVEAVEKLFQLRQGALSKENFNPHVVDSTEPKPPGPDQLATLTLPIPANKLERILRILNE